jgi:diguanylate cyclase
MIIRIADLFSRRSAIVVLLVAMLAGLTAGLSGWGSSTENRLDNLRHVLFKKGASGETVLVEIDSRSLQEVQAWPWPRSIHGRLLDRLSEAGARLVVFDIVFAEPALDPRQDEAFSAAIARAAGRVVLPASLENADGEYGGRVEFLPHAPLRANAQVGTIWARLDNDLFGRRLPYSVHIAGEPRPSLATFLADLPSTRSGEFVLDWTFDIHTFPRISFADVLKGKYDPAFFQGKNVLIGATSSTLGDRVLTPHQGRIPGMFVQAVGAETLRRYDPVPVGYVAALAAALAAIAATVLIRNPLLRVVGLGAGAAGAVMIPFVIREHSPYVVSVGPALIAFMAAIMTAMATALNKAVLARVMLSPGSHLPNLTAMSLARSDGPVTVAVRLRNHAETAARLGRELQGDLLRKVYGRLSLAASGADVYQVDEHSFAWRTDRGADETADSIEGLHALFASGIPLGDRTVDVTITVGLSDDPALEAEAAVAAALVAANRAEQRSLSWERYQAEDQDDADWRLSLLGELDRAIDHGDVWIAYQPKYDLRTRRIVGAEALARWSHPERGEIRPEQFIPIVEESGRIEKLTLHVLRRALADFSCLEDDSLTVAVNISMRMIGRNRLAEPIQEMLHQYRIDPARLTLEITESAAMTGDAGIEELRALRALGIHISIDDYGTGQSTLSYLKTLPATELKIDRSFVQLILSNRSDATVVDSTVKLAHALGLTVVAEGVETEEILIQLQKMHCDLVQGYHIGRPGSFNEFLSTVTRHRRTRAA